MNLLRKLVLGAVVGGLVAAGAIAFAHAIIIKSDDWRDRAGNALIIGAIGGGIGAIAPLLLRKRD